MRLSAPTRVLFIISLVLAGLALISALGLISIRLGVFGTTEIALLAYALLAAGVLFKRL